MTDEPDDYWTRPCPRLNGQLISLECIMPDGLCKNHEEVRKQLRADRLAKTIIPIELS